MQALNNFCREGGITRNDATAHLHKLDHHVRLDLDACSPRCLAVLEPLRLVLANLPPDHHILVQGRVKLLSEPQALHGLMLHHSGIGGQAGRLACAALVIPSLSLGPALRLQGIPPCCGCVRSKAGGAG